MKVSSQDVNISDCAACAEALDAAIELASSGQAVWLEAGGQEIAAIVPPEVLRFYIFAVAGKAWRTWLATLTLSPDERKQDRIYAQQKEIDRLQKIVDKDRKKDG